jgi:rhodanese-related sulfurtransferase
MSNDPILELDVTTLRDRLNAGEPITLLDVREPAEREAARLPAAADRDLFIPMREVPGRLEAVREALAKGPVVAYCHHGVRSMDVARWLAANGLPGVLNLQGGVDAWSIAVDPSVPRD